MTLPESTPPSQNIPPFSTTIILCDHPRIHPPLPEYTPLFNKFICATLPESTPPSQNIPPNQTTMRPSQNLPLPLRIYPLFQQIHMCDPPRIYPSLPGNTPIFNNYFIMRPSQNLPPPPPRIYPLLNNCMRPLQNLPLRPPSPPQNIPPFSTNLYV